MEPRISLLSASPRVGGNGMRKTQDGLQILEYTWLITFPVPTLTDKNHADLTQCAEDILLVREAHFPATIANLYEPETMPTDLRAAHNCNDEVLERIYIGRRFKNDSERLEKLFEMYSNKSGRSTVT